MKYYYSPAQEGFYLDEVHGDNIPSDVFEISEDAYNALLLGQQNGQQITYAAGKLQLTDPVIVITWDSVRSKRDRLLDDSDWTQVPDNSLTDNQRGQWKAYRQKLRDLPDAFSQAPEVIWPAIPPS